jgi:hypothetical protein
MTSIDSIYSDAVFSSEVTERALRTSSLAGRQTRDVLDELTRQLRLSVETLDDASYEVLGLLLRSIEVNVDQEGPWEWVKDIEGRRHVRITESAIENILLDDLITAAREFGWRRQRIEATDLTDLPKEVRSLLTSLLSDRVRQLLHDWRERNVWNHVMETRHERMARIRTENEKRPAS